VVERGGEGKEVLGGEGRVGREGVAGCELTGEGVGRLEPLANLANPPCSSNF